MSEAALQRKNETALLRKECDDDCLRVFGSAQGMAEITDCSLIHPSHLLLAVLSQTDGYLDEKLRLNFGGLKAATIADSLREILELDAPANSEEGRQAGDLFQISCTASSLAVLAKAADLARLWNAPQITLPALICALLEHLDAYAEDAFGDASMGQKELNELAAEIAQEEAAKKANASGTKVGAKEVFREDYVCLESFGPVASNALLALTQMGDGRPLLAEDMLIAFLADERSRTVEALHVIGVSPGAALRTLSQRYGEIRGARGVALDRSRIGRMLSRILEQAGELASKENSELIGESHLMRAYLLRVGTEPGNILEKLGIPALRLTEYLSKYKQDRDPTGSAPGGAPMMADVEGCLRQRVVGQEKAIQAVVPALHRMRLGMNESGRPLGVFLFLGATGVGKTELAKALADIAFGPKPGTADPYLIRIECGSLTEPRDIVQLLGAPQGLVGYKEGKLTNGLREKGNRCVVLFDEAEKAHPKVWQSLLTFFDEGIVTEADGTCYDATGCILVATSNLGYKEAIDKFRLYELSSTELDQLRPRVEEFIWERVTEYFSPEFRGRFGRENVLFFDHFDQADYRAIIVKQVAALATDMQARGVECTVDDAVIDKLVEFAWERRNEGARTVRRLVTGYLRDQIVDGIAADSQRSVFHFFMGEDGDIDAGPGKNNGHL